EDTGADRVDVCPWCDVDVAGPDDPDFPDRDPGHRVCRLRSVLRAAIQPGQRHARRSAVAADAGGHRVMPAMRAIATCRVLLSLVLALPMLAHAQ
ncbi:hypothetical protein CN950_28660, partial [Bacillus cereus]